MFGPFFQSLPALSGLVFKRRFRLSQPQKLRLRRRLRLVDSVIDALVESGVKLRALEAAKLIPKEHQLTPFQKYWTHSKRYRDGIKPLHWVPHWVKAPHPRSFAHPVYHRPLSNRN